jgi:NO-binding membrane sensor protein with MHYT domain
MQQITDILGQIAPYMIMVAYAGVAIAVIAVLAFFSRLFSGRNNWLLQLTSRLLILLGVVFLAYQGAIMATGFVPADNAFFGKPFWMLALALLVAGFVFRLIGSLRPTR